MPFDGRAQNQVSMDLRAAMALIENPANWARGAMARTRDGHLTQPWRSDAAAFCAKGAVARVTREASRHVAPSRRFLDAVNALNQASPRDVGIVFVNDHSGHAAVMGVFRLAIYQTEKTNAI